MNEREKEQIAQARSLVLYEFYKRNPLEWVKDVVSTHDEHDRENPIKRFPVRPYVATLIKEWEAEPLLHIAKSRQMQASWLAVALLLHEAQFFDYRLQAVFSKKADDAAAIVERGKFIYNHQPLWLRNLCPLDRKMRDMPNGDLFFANGSKMRSFAQGAEQIRSYVPSTALIDEAAFQDELAATYGACVPCCQKIVTVSSANEGFFHRLVEVGASEQVLPGLNVGRNSQGHRVIRLHYTADPDKNPTTETGKQWFERTVSRYMGGTTDLKWRQEMEIDFSAGSGELVFPAFVRDEDKFVVTPFAIDDKFVLFGGMDWGTRNPIAMGVYAVAPGGRKFKIWDFKGERIPVSEVCRIWHECPYYARLQVIWGDPTMWSETVARKDGFTSIAEMMSDEEAVGNYTIDKLAPAHGRSDEACINVLRNMWIKEPAEFQLFRTCNNTIDELRSLKHPERKEFVNEAEKIVDKNNHNWDETKYFLLSHPYWITNNAKPAFGTYAYLNEVSALAEQIARDKGTSVQSEFNDLYGMDI